MNNLSGSEEATVQHIKDNVTKSENGKYVLPKEVSLGVGLMVRVALAKEGIVIKHDNCQTPVLAFSTKKVLRSEYDERVERRKEEADTNRIVQKVESESAPVATKRGLKGFETGSIRILENLKNISVKSDRSST